MAKGDQTRVRFDDSLQTVLNADTATAFGARAAFRQLVDLLGRRRVAVSDALLARLADLRAHVPAETRSGVARGLALADPPPALVGFFAQDEPEVAAAVLRVARLAPEEWETLLPAIGPLGRSVLRRRRDLPPLVARALEAFGSTDFAIGHDRVAEEPAAPPAAPVAGPSPAPEPADTSPFRAVGALAADLPLVAEARRREEAEPRPARNDAVGERFEIADLARRIEAYQRDRVPLAPRAEPSPAVAAFRFETDAAGTIRWVDTGPRGAIVGVSLRHRADDPHPPVDGVVWGAFRKRAAFADARLQIAGASLLAGDWRISGVPVFDQATGSFLGYRGRARRPRFDEDAAHRRPPRNAAGSEGLRRLVHELRTPTNAIAGFSELIEQQLLGPVPDTYRERAAAIRRQAAGLIGAIEDLDLSARLESDALDLHPAPQPLAPLLARVAEELAPLASLRGSRLELPHAAQATWSVDGRAAERLVARLLATLLSATARGEALHVDLLGEDGAVTLAIDRPAALAGRDEAALLTADDAVADDDGDAPLLGMGFALRLVRNLAQELGGRFAIGAGRLTLTLPAVSNGGMGQASTFAP